MNLSRLVFLFACLILEAVAIPFSEAASVNPFDAHRLDSQIETRIVGRALGEASPSSVKQSRRHGFFCGLQSDLGQMRICVDGKWLNQLTFEKAYGSQIIQASGLAVKLSTGTVLSIGEVFPHWDRSTHKKVLK